MTITFLFPFPSFFFGGDNYCRPLDNHLPFNLSSLETAQVDIEIGPQKIDDLNPLPLFTDGFVIGAEDVFHDETATRFQHAVDLPERLAGTGKMVERCPAGDQIEVFVRKRKGGRLGLDESDIFLARRGSAAPRTLSLFLQDQT